MNLGHTDAPLAEEAASKATADIEPPKSHMVVILTAALRTVWDRLGLLLAVSVTWAAMVSLPLSIERGLPRSAAPALHVLCLALIPLLAALPTAGTFALVHRFASFEETLYVHLWQDGAALFGTALRLMLLQTGVVAALVTAMTFYAGLTLWIGRAGVTVAGYGLLLWAMMSIYQWPLLIAQEKGLFDEPGKPARRGAFAAVRRSFYLTLGRPFFTAGLLAILLLASAVMAVTVVLPALLWIGAVAVVSTLACRALLIEFRALTAPVRREPVPDLQFRIADRRSPPEG